MTSIEDTILKISIVLPVILLLIFASLYALKKFTSRNTFSKSGKFSLVERISLPNGCYLCLVTLDNKGFVISVGKTDVRKIAELENYEPARLKNG